MSALYLVRHGQTLFNVLRRKQGWSDSPLTELGIEQGRAAGAWLAANAPAFDHVYSSTAERCCDTAELLVPGQPYQRVKCLKEINFGHFEGLTEDVDVPLPYGDYYARFGGETDDELRERVVAGLLEIMGRPGHECVLAVSHSVAMMQVPRAFGDDWRRHSDAERMPNCAIFCFDFDGQALTLREVIDPMAD